MQLLANEINALWARICGGHAEPVHEEALLVKRVKWIGEQLRCAEENFRITNQAYCKLDVETRELRGLHFADSEGRAIPHRLRWDFEFSSYFMFGPDPDQICRYPTVSIISSTTGKTIRCHDTLTKGQWMAEPWYGELAIFRMVSLSTSTSRGRRLWVYTRWGCCHFDLYWKRAKPRPVDGENPVQAGEGTPQDE